MFCDDCKVHRLGVAAASNSLWDFVLIPLTLGLWLFVAIYEALRRPVYDCPVCGWSTDMRRGAGELAGRWKLGLFGLSFLIAVVAQKTGVLGGWR